MGLLQKTLCFLFITLVCVSLIQAKQEPREVRQCKQQCRQQTRLDDRQKWLCVKSCEQKADDSEMDMNDRSRDRESDESWNENPYVFKDQHFRTEFRSNEGRIRVLPKFTERSSRLFKGIQNYRVLLFEASPQTFIVPTHWDADIVFFVAQGRGTVTLVFTDRRESFNIEQGHVMIVPAGVTAYLINRDDNQKLVLAKLLYPVSNPGRFEAFISSANRNVESYFNGFSPEVLEAAYQASRGDLQKIFAPRTDEGVMRRASKEQIRALTHDENSLWPFSGKSSKVDYSPLDLFKQGPKESNQYGNLFVIDTQDNQVLRELGLAVSFANITQGAMHAIYYNSRATKIAVVVNGCGKLEMACPHVAKSGDQQRHDDSGRSRQRDERDTGRSRQWDESDTGRSRQQDESETPIEYKKLTAELRPGTVYIIPPGHPYVAMASQNENLQIFCFEVNAVYNHKFPLSGKKNILKNIERAAKQLTYGSSADEVDSVFNKRDEDFFFPGPRQQRRHSDFSIV